MIGGDSESLPRLGSLQNAPTERLRTTFKVIFLPFDGAAQLGIWMAGAGNYFLLNDHEEA